MGTYLYGDACRFSLVVNEDMLDAFAEIVGQEWGYSLGPDDSVERLTNARELFRVEPREPFWLGDASWGYCDALKAFVAPCELGSFVEVMTLDDGLVFERFERTASGVECSVRCGTNPFCEGEVVCQ